MEFDLGCACRGNNLDKMLQPTVLAILFKRKMYGSYIIEELAKSPMFGDERPDKAGVYRYLKRMEKEEEAKKEIAKEIEDIDENIESYKEIEEIIQPEEMMDIDSFKESLDFSENEFYDVKDFVRQNWEGRMNDL